MPKTCVFIDSRVNDQNFLISQFLPGTEYSVLDASRDGIEQIVTALGGQSGYDSIQIISHGSPGSLTIGSTELNSTTLDFYASELSLIGNALTESGDLLLYGCDVAVGDKGHQFIETLSQMTGADVAASDDSTGGRATGGDSVLEVQTGAVEAIGLNLSDYKELLGPDSLLPATLASPPYSWGGISFQTRVDAELTTSDPLNTLRSGCYWDRYSLTGVANGTTVYLYMGNSSTVDDFLQIERNASLLASNDDSGDGERSYDSFIGWSYQAGDVIRATTYSAGNTGTYSLYVSSGTFTDIGSNNLGVVTFTGTPLQGETLTAQMPTDLDGVASAVSYRWQLSTNNINWYDVPDPRGQATSFTLAQSESGKYIRVQAFYSDGNHVQESPVSSAQIVVDLEEPGSITISGGAVTGYTLHTAITDPDGIVNAIPAYHWQSSIDGNTGWVNVTGANQSTYTLINSDAGNFFRVVTTYTDDMGHLEQNITSDATAQVILNVPPVITLPGGGNPPTTHFIEQTPLPVSSDIIVNDSDGDASWNGGLLKVQITSNAESADSLHLPAINPGGSGIWLNSAGNKVMAGSTEIGVADAYSVSGGAAWLFTFNASATNTLVQDVARSLIFGNSSDNPGIADRAITFTVTDNFAVSASAVQVVAVTRVNDAPALSVGSNDTAWESTTFNHQIMIGDPDPDSHQVTVNWGDGTAETQFDTTDHYITISHNFADNGIHTVTVTADDLQGQANSVESDSFQVTVNNVAPVASLTGIDRLNTGSTYTLNVGSVVDPGPDTRTSYSINWGDGTTNNFTPDEWAAAAGSFSHTYTAATHAETVRTITANTTDEDGSFVLGSKVVIVNRAPSDIYLSSASIAENSLPGTLIGTLHTTDDESGSYNYQLLDDAGGRFVLVGDQIQVAEGAVLDYESSLTHLIRVSSTDYAGLSFEKTLSVNLTDAGPDLLVSRITTPQGVVDVDAGSSIEVTWTLATQGTEPSNGSWTDRIWLDNPDTAWLDRLAGEFQTSAQLPLSGSLDRVQTVTIPFDMQGTFHVVVQTDIYNTVKEGTLGESNNTTTGSVLFNVLNTNLHVESVTAPSSGFAGREIEVQWVVKNTGNASTTARTWYDQIYLSDDTTLDGTDLLLGTVQNSSYLDIGQAYTTTAKVNLPVGREGDYHILVKTDGYQYIQEGSGEGDNVTSSGVVNIQPIPLSELSDLAVVSVGAPSQALSGQNMSLTYTIDNAGQAAIATTSPVWVERIYMSSDNVLDGSDRLMNTIWRYLPAAKLPQPEGQSHFTAMEKVTLPVGVEGEFYFFVTVAPVAPVSNAFPFNDVAYDSTATLVRLTPPPDLEASGILAPSTVIAGHDLTVSYRVLNSGSTTTPNASWRDTLYLSSDTTLDAGDMKLADVWHSGALEPTGGATLLPMSQAISQYNSGAATGYYINTVTVRLPDTLQGSWHLVTSADSYNDVFELDNTNNIYVATDVITIDTRPADLVVTDVTAPKAMQAGTSLRLSWTVLNQGVGETTTQQWTDRVVFSRDAVLGNGDDVTLGYFSHTGILIAGQSYTTSGMVSLPGSLSGQYQLFVVTDTYNQVYESGQENNNSRLLGVGVDGQPGTGLLIQDQSTADLQVASVTAPQSVASGDWLTVSYTVVNAGKGRTNAEWWVDNVILSQDDTIGNADDVNLGNVYHSNRLNPGESYQGTGSFRLPIDMQGDYHVWVRTDAAGWVTEQDGENNNLGVAAQSTTITLTTTPDLLISTLNAADQGSSGQSLQVDWMVHNNGAATAGGWRQAFYLSRDGVLDRGSDIFLGYAESTGILAAGADLSLSNSFRIPDGISGKYYVFGVVDSNNAIYERNAEGNNVTLDTTAVQVTLSTPVDLVTGLITLPQNGIPGADASISYTVTNQSDQGVTGHWRDSIYLSTDSVWDVNDPLFTRVDISGPLAGHASYTQSVTGVLPGVIGGDYYVIVRSDIFNQIPETNEQNNIKASLDTTLMEVETLILGTPDAVTFAPGRAVYYRVDVAAGETLRINVDRDATQGRTELFVSYNAMPSRSDFDYQYTQADSPDQKLVISNTKAGSYYLMAYNASGATDTYSITADTLQFSITELGTTAGSNKGQVTVRINGAELTTHTTAMLVGPDGVEHAATQLYWKESTELWATFDLRGLSTDTYDVKVEDGARSAVLSDSFTVNKGDLGHVEYGMDTPSALRVGQTGVVRVYYQNLGQTDVVAPFLTVSGNALLKMPGDAEFAGTSLELLGINDKGPAGILSPGAQGSFQLFFKPDFSGAGTVNLGVSSLPADQVIDWNTILESSKPENISEDSWATVKANLMAELGVTTTDFEHNLAVNATRLDQLENRTDNIATLVSLDYMKATDGGALLRSAALGALGYSHTFVWDITAIRQSDGSMIVDIAGAQERFTLQSDGSYKLVGQGTSTLTETGGAFEFHQQNGSSIAFNLDGTFSAIHDSNAQGVQAIYDAGHLTQVVATNGDTLSFIYNAEGRLIQQTDQAGRMVMFAYDAGNQYLTSVSSLAGTTEYSYVTDPGASLHRISSITLPDGTVQHFAYDSNGQMISENLNNGAESITYSYVGINEVLATDATGATTHVWLNERGQIAQVEDALGHVSQLRYDSNGNMTGIANADGTSTSIQYDTAGNPLSVQDALGHTIDFSWEVQFGHLAQVTDQRGNAIGYGYDSQGNMNHITFADGSSDSYTYNANGYLNVAVNQRGESVTYTFDAKGNVTQKSYADGSIATYTYDAHGNLTSAVDADSSTAFQYDTADRLTRVTDGDGRWLSYQYDAAGHRIEMADQSGNVTHYSYDTLGHLAQLTDGDGNLIASYSYDAAGHLSRGDNGNGTYTTYSYDLAGQLTHLVNYKVGGTLNSSFDYTYDAAGHRTSETTQGGTTSYEYDAVGQLTGTTLPDGHHIAYHYDAAGNRTSVEDAGATINYVTNTLNEYTGVGTATYNYDTDGNLTSKSVNGVTTNYGYDAESHLVSVTTPSDTWNYEYDALGNRIASVHNGARTEYQLDPTGMVNVAGEYDSSGNLIAEYTYGLGLESETLAGSVTAYYDYNAIGSTTGLTGSTGDYVNHYSYLPFGENIVTTETVANSFEYVGQWGVMDGGNGLDFMRARFYSEVEGRFISTDPIGINGGLNLYQYANGNPVDYVDPTGLKVYVGQHGAFGLPDWTLNHAAIVLVPDNPADFANNSVFSSSGGTIATLGGQAFGSGGGPLFGSLQGVSNYPGDAIGNLSDLTLVDPPAGMTDTEFINELISTFNSYDNSLWYDPFPDPWGFTYNSNSFVSGLLDAVGAEVPDLPGLRPGYTRPIPIVRPSDPNDIVGPQGFGDEHWISNQSALPYTIHYENQASASAPAQEVTITQTLDSDLNPGSFRLGDFGWSDIYVDVPDGVSFYIDRIDLRDTKGYMVDVMAGVDLAKHEIYWTFTTIDPETGEIPDDPTIGFLPTNVVKGTGEGFVNYTVRANSDAPTGTVVDAQATIVFTTQEPIDTPAIFNTLDTVAPGSFVEAMAGSTVQNAQFLVQWSGSDVGSAIASYSVYVSDNGGAYTPWLENTTLLEATYAGQPGHTYAFYSIATDNAGNKEAAPQAERTILVSAGATLIDTVLPQITAVVLPVDTFYPAGQSLNFGVKFSEPVFVDVAGLPPVIKVTIGTTEVDALYHSGSGTDTLIFSHTVAIGEYDSDGIALGNAIVLNGATLRDVAGNPVVDLSLVTASTAGILVDNPPTLQTALPDQSGTEDQSFLFQVPADTFTDVDAGDSLSYTAALANGDPLPGWLSFDTLTRTFSGTPLNGAAIDLKVTATDSSHATGSDTFALTVANINDLPTGNVTIQGTAIEGLTLTAESNTLADADGLGLLHYQWKADGVTIDGAISSTFVPGSAEVGKTITVIASYTDGQGTPESVGSLASSSVEPFADLISPTVTSFSPTDAASGVAVGQDILLTFSEAIQKGTGLIAIHRDSPTGAIVESYDVATSTNLTVSGTSLTINPTLNLSYSTHYFVTLASGSVKDLAGNSYAGTDAYDFTTAAPPHHNLTGAVTFWKTAATIADVTTTLDSAPAASGSQLVEFRNIVLNPDGSRSLEIWETSAKTDINDLQLELLLPAGSTSSWQDATGFPSDWISEANTLVSGQFFLAGMGLTPLSVGPVKLGTLTLSAPANPQHFELSLSLGQLGSDTVPGFTIVSDSMTTAFDGFYQHLGMTEGAYTLTSAKVTGTAESNAVMANDAFAALKMAVGINPNTDGSRVLSYQYLAADVNKDGQIKVADAFNILKMAVKLDTAPASEWLFVPESVGSQSMTRTHVVWPDNPVPVTLDVNQDLNLIGIVKGDVNGSWVA